MVLERNTYPSGVPCWIDTAQPDPESAVAFYRGLFDWEFVDRMPADVAGQYFLAQLRGRDVAAVGSVREGMPTTPVWSTYIAVHSADDAAAKVEEAGGTTLMEPFDVLDAGRMATFADPFGAVFSVWEANQHIGAQLVNEPNTWNWSDLNTRDPEGCKAFYGAVFGWEADTVDFGYGQATMFRRPGYGHILDLKDPDLRRRQAAAGWPTGFEDTIGWIRPMTADQFPEDLPPHWSVTFAVDDTDAMVQRATELGGAVEMPAMDFGEIRIAALRDPQGAGFLVSRYQPG